MTLYLVNNTKALSAKQSPDRPPSEVGRAEADRVGTLMKASGAAPVRFLHSDKLRTRETAERIAAILGLSDRVAQAKYGTGTDDDLHAFMEDIEEGGDLLIVGHVDHLMRAAGLSAPVFHAAMLELEITGQVTRHAGNRFSLDLA